MLVSGIHSSSSLRSFNDQYAVTGQYLVLFPDFFGDDGFVNGYRNTILFFPDKLIENGLKTAVFFDLLYLVVEFDFHSCNRLMQNFRNGERESMVTFPCGSITCIRFVGYNLSRNGTPKVLTNVECFLLQ